MLHFPVAFMNRHSQTESAVYRFSVFPNARLFRLFYSIFIHLVAVERVEGVLVRKQYMTFSSTWYSQHSVADYYWEALSGNSKRGEKRRGLKTVYNGFLK